MAHLGTPAAMSSHVAVVVATSSALHVRVCVPGPSRFPGPRRGRRGSAGSRAEDFEDGDASDPDDASRASSGPRGSKRGSVKGGEGGSLGEGTGTVVIAGASREESDPDYLKFPGAGVCPTLWQAG